MTWSRLLGILTLALLVSAASVASVAGIVLTFALLMPYLGWQTVWNEIFPWATDRLDMITTYLAGGTVLASVLMKRLARERA
jgi:fucose permease